jgi:hypothetical protein
MSSRHMLAACQVLYTPSAMCLGCTQVKNYLFFSALILSKLGSMGMHSYDLYVLTCLYYIWRFLFTTMSMLMFGEVSNTLTFSCGWDVPILYQGVGLLTAEY